MVAAYLAVALGTMWRRSALSPDSLEYAAIARNLVEGHGFTVDLIAIHPSLSQSIRQVPEMHGLLLPLVLAGVFEVFGVDGGVVSLPGFVYVASTALVAFALGRAVFGGAAGLLACIMVLGSPSMSLWAYTGADDPGLAFFFAASFYFFYRGLVDGKAES